MIRVILPTHLRTLANVDREVELTVDEPATIDAVLTRLEALYPMLRGTMRDFVSKQRRPFIRFFVTGQDWSLEAYDRTLPREIAEGHEPLRVVGAMAGG
ncbi:MAG TPA: MoaD/ThiS family protein [Anaerolinea sp.]|nr:MoaD/ThiS family protein [Anaerolinea sp.]